MFDQLYDDNTLLFDDLSKDLLKSRRNGIVTIIKNDQVNVSDQKIILHDYTLLPSTLINIINEYTSETINVYVSDSSHYYGNAVNIKTSKYDIIIIEDRIFIINDLSLSILKREIVITNDKDMTIKPFNTDVKSTDHDDLLIRFMNKIVSNKNDNKLIFRDIHKYEYNTIPYLTYYLLVTNYYDRIYIIKDNEKMKEMIMVIKLFMNFIIQR